MLKRVKVHSQKLFRSINNSEKDDFFVSFYFVVQFLLDFVQKVSMRFDLGFYPYHRYLKLLFLLYLVFKLAFGFKKLSHNKVLKYVLFLCVVFLIPANFSSSRLEYFIQYLFFLFVLLFFSSRFKLKLDSIYYLFRAIVIINFGLIICGLFFNIYVFETYSVNRFGYNGMIITPMQTSVFYLSSFAISIYFKDYFLMVLIVLSSLFCGTKALLLGIPITYFIFYILNGRKKKHKNITITLAFVSLFALVKLFSSKLFTDIIEKQGFITGVLSYRDKLFSRAILNIENHYSLINYIFGGTDLILYKTELDFIDVFLFFGILGLILFYFIFKFIYKEYCTSSISKSYFISIILAAFLGGNIIVYPFNSFVFLLSLKLIHDSQ